MAEIAQLRRDLDSLASAVSGIRAELPVGGVKDLVDQIKMMKAEAINNQTDTSAKLAELAGKVDVVMNVIKHPTVPGPGKDELKTKEGEKHIPMKWSGEKTKRSFNEYSFELSN